jgi:hypothetical protein
MNNQIKFNQIAFSLLICFLFGSCGKNELTKTEVYNQKANDLIFQTLEENKCDCLLEIPKESMIEISNLENPSYDIRNITMKQLNLKSNSDLDTLVNTSKNFQLDLEKATKSNVKIITEKDLWKIKKANYNEIVKLCPKGIICVQKPIFDENYKKAVFEFNYAFTCVRVLPYQVYEFVNGKWNRVEK